MRSLGKLDRDSDVFDWWRTYQKQFPSISKAAKILLAIPPTSVSSERLFSKAGLLYANKLRNRLLPKKNFKF